MISAFGVEDNRLSKAEKKPGQKSGTGDIVGGTLGATGGGYLVVGNARKANEFKHVQHDYERNARAFQGDADKIVGSKWEHVRPGLESFAREHTRQAGIARSAKLAHLGGVGLGAAGLAGGGALIAAGARKNRARGKANQS
jgi:hypothetical protein